MPAFNPQSAIRNPQYLLVILTVIPALAGCEESHRLVSYPPGALPVEFAPSTSFSTCLVAGVVMAANYLEDSQRFKVKDVVAELRSYRGDETKVSDLKEYLAGKGLYLASLAGRTDDEPPTGLGFWVRRQRYPVVCVINRVGSPAFNHAVVVIGMAENLGVESADTIHYLDPSADSPLFSCSEESFEAMWAQCRHAMLIVTRPPAGSEPDVPVRDGSARDTAGNGRISPEVKP